MTTFVPKAWQNLPSLTTPMSGPAITDIEQRLSDLAFALATPEVVDAGTTFGTTTLDMTGRQNVLWHVRLGGNHTLQITNWSGTQSVALILRQDSVGARVPVLPTALWGQSGTLPTLSTGADEIDILTFVSDRYVPTNYPNMVVNDLASAYYRLGEASGTTCADFLLGVNNGTYVNSPTLGVTGALTGDANKAVTFDGVDERALLTTLGTMGSNAKNATYEFWVKTGSTQAGAVFGSVTTGLQIIGCYLNMDGAEVATPGKTCFDLRSPTGPVHQRGEISTNIYDNQWHHVCWTTMGDNQAHRVLVDGALVTVTMNSNGAPVMNNHDVAFTIGARNNSGGPDRFAAASIDEVAFYTRRLSLDRIQRHYAGGRQTMFGNTYGGLFDTDFQ